MDRSDRTGNTSEDEGFVVYKVANFLTELYQFEIDEPGLEKLELLTVKCTGAGKSFVSYTREEVLKK